MLEVGEMGDRLKLAWREATVEQILLEMKYEIISSTIKGHTLPIWLIEAYNTLAEEEETVD